MKCCILRRDEMSGRKQTAQAASQLLRIETHKLYKSVMACRISCHKQKTHADISEVSNEFQKDAMLPHADDCTNQHNEIGPATFDYKLHMSPFTDINGDPFKGCTRTTVKYTWEPQDSPKSVHNLF